jgi:hypothetical protein
MRLYRIPSWDFFVAGGLYFSCSAKFIPRKLRPITHVSFSDLGTTFQNFLLYAMSVTQINIQSELLIVLRVLEAIIVIVIYICCCETVL